MSNAIPLCNLKNPFDEVGDDEIVDSGIAINPQPVSFEVCPDYKLLLQFANGETRQFDVKPFLKRSAFIHELANLSYFNQADFIDNTICWPNGQDFCPDMLYRLSTPVQHVCTAQ